MHDGRINPPNLSLGYRFLSVKIPGLSSEIIKSEVYFMVFTSDLEIMPKTTAKGTCLDEPVCALFPFAPLSCY